MKIILGLAMITLGGAPLSCYGATPISIFLDYFV